MTVDDSEVDLVIRRAHGAFLSARDVAPSVRSDWLESIAIGLEGSAEELCALAHEESSLPLARLRGELARTIFQLRLLADEVVVGLIFDVVIDHADPNWGMGPRPDIRRMSVPLGVVGVFGASNFPFAFSVIGGDSAAALAAGCAVVHKIHEAHEGLGRRVAEIVAASLENAGAPDGLFAVVEGKDAGLDLVDHELVKAVAFTGSARIGRLLADRAAARKEPIPFFGEMGSLNPVFVTQRRWETQREAILREYVASFTMGMGQFCTKPGLLFTPALKPSDNDLLRDLLSDVEVHPMLSRNLSASYAESMSRVVDGSGISPLVMGDSGQTPSPSLLVTTVDEVIQKPSVLREELFGPGSVIVQYRNESELAEMCALLEGQLTGTIHAEIDEDQTALRLALESKCGRVLWNSWPTGVTVSYAQTHGGPYPATTSSSSTSVGTAAIQRFMRPVAFQGFPAEALPVMVQDSNPYQVPQRVDGVPRAVRRGGEDEAQ